MVKASSPGSAYTVSDSESDDFLPEGSSSPKKSGPKRVNKAKAAASHTRKAKVERGAVVKGKRKALELDMEDAVSGPIIQRPHPRSYHDVRAVEQLQEDLLAWFESVRYISTCPATGSGAYVTGRREACLGENDTTLV